MAITTENTYLCTKSGSSYTKLVDIKEFPDLGSAPSTVDITTLSDHQKKYLAGLKDPGTLEFTSNYDTAAWTAVNAIAGTSTNFAIVFGTVNGTTVTAVNGAFEFTGTASAWVKGAGVEAPVEMGIAIVVSSEITKA